MVSSRALQAALLVCCLSLASGQTLYQRPSNFSRDCLPATTTATTFAAIFPSDFYLTGGQVSAQDESTKVRGQLPAYCCPFGGGGLTCHSANLGATRPTITTQRCKQSRVPPIASKRQPDAVCPMQVTIAKNFAVEYFPSYKVSRKIAWCCRLPDDTVV